MDIVSEIKGIIVEREYLRPIVEKAKLYRIMGCKETSIDFEYDPQRWEGYSIEDILTAFKGALSDIELEGRTEKLEEENMYRIYFAW